MLQGKVLFVPQKRPDVVRQDGVMPRTYRCRFVLSVKLGCRGDATSAGGNFWLSFCCFNHCLLTITRENHCVGSIGAISARKQFA